MENIIVAVRIKPSPKPINQDCWKVIKDTHNGVILNMRNKQSYTFDQVFTENSTNELIFDQLALPIIQSCIEGLNCTVFAYGQTSSGKTFTMQGSKESPGLVRQSIDYLFKSLLEKGENFSIRISFIEIYNEQINDLLDPSKINLEIREHPEKGIYIDRLSEIVVVSADQAFNMLDAGESFRKVAETQMNSVSSRSHCVFRVMVESSNGFASRNSLLNLVDLAGSEGVQKSKTEDLRSREGSNINKSLLSLSSVIQKLSDSKGSKGFINFRDSKITRLLQPSLTGNSRTAIICTVNPEASHYQESNNTLMFGMRAKRIKNDVNINQMLIGEQQIKELTSENKKLSEKVQEYEKIINELEGREAVFLQKIEKFSSEISELKNLVIRMEHEKDQVYFELTQSNENNSKMTVLIDQYEKRIDIKSNKIKLIEDQLNENNRVKVELENELFKINCEKNGIFSSLRQLKAEKLELEIEKSELIELIASKDFLIAKETQKNQDYEKMCEILNSQMKDLQKDLETSKQQQEILTENYSQTIDELERQKIEDLSKYQQIFQENLDQKLIQDKKIHHLSKKNLKITEINESLSFQLSKTKSKYRNFKEKSKFHSSEYQQLTEEKSFLTQTLQDERLKNIQQVKTLNEEITSNQESILNLENFNKKLKEDIEELQKDLDFQINEKLLLEQENFRLEYDYNIKENCITIQCDKENPEFSRILEEKLEILENYEKIKEKLEKETEKSSNLADMIKTQEKVLESLRTSNQETESKLSEATENIKELKKQISLKRTSQSLIDGDLFRPLEESERFNTKVLISNFQYEVNLLNSEISSLKQENTKLKEKSFSFNDDEKLKLKLEISDLEKKLSKIHNDNGYLRAQLERISQETENLPHFTKKISMKKNRMKLDLGDSPKCKQM